MMRGFNIRLGSWRRHRGLTQAALAARAGIPQPAVSEAEMGKRDVGLRTIVRLAAALGITPGTLLDSDPPRHPLDRHAVDAVARAAVTGRRDLPAGQRRLADACAAAMRPTLEACAVPGAARASRRGIRSVHAAKQRYGEDVFDLILERIDRFAGAEAR
jgi:transcriptional regulator with XRE-family HTH domain